jgi:hypothetical protein
MGTHFTTARAPTRTMSRHFFALLGLITFVALTPLSDARAEGEFFGKNCTLTVEREMERIPVDNALKYGMLGFLALSPELVGPASPFAQGAIASELKNDVAVAALKGVVGCIKDPKLRQTWRNRLEVGLAVGDMWGFTSDLANAAGLVEHADDVTGITTTGMPIGELIYKVGVSPNTISGLAGGGDLMREAFSEVSFGRPLGFQMKVQVLLRLAGTFTDECQYDSARQITQSLRAEMRAREQPAYNEMIAASRALTGRAITVESELLAFDPTPYLNTNARDVSLFIGALGDHRLIGRLMPDADALAEKIERKAPDYAARYAGLHANLDDAENALKQCNYPRLASAMNVVGTDWGVAAYSPVNTALGALHDIFLSGDTDQPISDTLFLQRKEATRDGCWGDVVRRYNDIVEDFGELGDVNVAGRDDDKLDFAIALGKRAAETCDLEGAQRALDYAGSFLPASLDPGDLCFDPQRAEDRIAELRGEIGRARDTCDAEIVLTTIDEPDEDTPCPIAVGEDGVLIKRYCAEEAEGLAAGHYVVRMSGGGWRKHAFGKAIKIDGYQDFVVEVTGEVDAPERTGGGRWLLPVGGLFADVTPIWQDAAEASSVKACRRGKPQCPCKTPPDIWASGPLYDLVGGPFPTSNEALDIAGNPRGKNRADGSAKHWTYDKERKAEEVNAVCDRIIAAAE